MHRAMSVQLMTCNSACSHTCRTTVSWLLLFSVILRPVSLHNFVCRRPGPWPRVVRSTRAGAQHAHLAAAAAPTAGAAAPLPPQPRCHRNGPGQPARERQASGHNSGRHGSGGHDSSWHGSGRSSSAAAAVRLAVWRLRQQRHLRRHVPDTAARQHRIRTAACIRSKRDYQGGLTQDEISFEGQSSIVVADAVYQPFCSGILNVCTTQRCHQRTLACCRYRNSEMRPFICSSACSRTTAVVAGTRKNRIHALLACKQ